MPHLSTSSRFVLPVLLIVTCLPTGTAQGERATIKEEWAAATIEAIGKAGNAGEEAALASRALEKFQAEVRRKETNMESRNGITRTAKKGQRTTSSYLTALTITIS